jgi:tetratricopeptide (TPR) repeat protein
MINKKKLMHFFYSDDYDYDRNKAEELRIIFKKYLKENPCDTEVWIKFALLLYSALLHEDLKAQKCLETILEYDANNIQVKLFLVYIIEHYSYIDEDLFEILNKIKTPNKELMSLVEYSKSSYYYLTKEDFDSYELCLKKSIELCDKYVSNYVDLGQFYIKRGNIQQGYELMKKGLQNVEYVYDEAHPYDILDFEEFFNERFKGIHLSDSNYKIILESFDPLSPWITGDFTRKKGTNNTEVN